MCLISGNVKILWLIFPEHAKDALELAKMQEVTSQLKHKESIKVVHVIHT